VLFNLTKQRPLALPTAWVVGRSPIRDPQRRTPRLPNLEKDLRPIPAATDSQSPFSAQSMAVWQAPVLAAALAAKGSSSAAQSSSVGMTTPQTCATSVSLPASGFL
jgi:hypothetical protein